MKRSLCAGVLLFVLSMVQAHDFWLQPNKFVYTVGEEMVVDFMVGENFEGDFWDLARHKVEKIQISGNAMVKDLLKDVKSTAGKNLKYKFDREGTHMLGMESNTATIELEAD